MYSEVGRLSHLMRGTLSHQRKQKHIGIKGFGNVTENFSVCEIIFMQLLSGYEIMYYLCEVRGVLQVYLIRGTS
jgi:hypothetical protein